MTVLIKRVVPWTVCLTLTAVIAILTPSSSPAQVAPAITGAAPVASVDQLKSKALDALRAGNFKLTNDCLAQAAAIAKDPLTRKMAAWAEQFEKDRKELNDHRRQEYDKAARNVQLLQERHLPAYGLEIAAAAYVLSEDKDAFRKEPWVVQLLADAKATAEELEKTQQWLKSRQVFARLAFIEPEVSLWKERQRTAARRVYLLSFYAPEEFKRVLEQDIKQREEASAILQPATKPATKPTTQPMDEADKENQYKIDWREQLRGVSMPYVYRVVELAHDGYFRTVTYRKLLASGLRSLRVVLTTPALRTTFPGLAQADKRNEFLAMIDANLARIEGDTTRDELKTAEILLRDLLAANTDTVKLPEEVLVNEFGEGVVEALDEHCMIYWPSAAMEMQKMIDGQFSGVGIQIFSDESGNLKVETPLEGSPAYRAGIKPGDIITHINGKSARWITTNQAVKQITGPAKTKVALTVRNIKSETKVFNLVRDVIKVDTVRGFKRNPGGGWDYFIDPEQKISYVRVNQFNPTTGEDLGRAIDQMNAGGAKGIILDLRGNPGGVLNAAVDVVQHFISKGLIVSTRPDRADSPARPEILKADGSANPVSMPLIVLVDRGSASASEIVSGALKDHKRAMIVGQRTFGKGSVQTAFPLDRQKAVYFKVTTAHYYLPNGKCIHREENSKEWGVEPDLSIDMTPEQIVAVMEAHRSAEVLRDGATTEPAVQTNGDGTEKPAAKPKKELLAVDTQLSAALLMLRLQLANGQM